MLSEYIDFVLFQLKEKNCWKTTTTKRNKTTMGTKINSLPDKKEKKQRSSPAGNWTPVSRVTGGDTDHYTTEELHANSVKQKW